MSSRSHSQSKERGKKREKGRKKRGKRREEKRKRKRKKRNSCCSTTSPHLYSLSDNVVYSTPMSPDNKRAKELTQAAGVMPPAKVELKGVAFNNQRAFSRLTVAISSVQEPQPKPPTPRASKIISDPKSQKFVPILCLFPAPKCAAIQPSPSHRGRKHKPGAISGSC